MLDPIDIKLALGGRQVFINFRDSKRNGKLSRSRTRSFSPIQFCSNCFLVSSAAVFLGCHATLPHWRRRRRRLNVFRMLCIQCTCIVFTLFIPVHHYLSSVRHGTHKAFTVSERIPISSYTVDQVSADLLQVILGFPRCVHSMYY